VTIVTSSGHEEFKGASNREVSGAAGARRFEHQLPSRRRIPGRLRFFVEVRHNALYTLIIFALTMFTLNLFFLSLE